MTPTNNDPLGVIIGSKSTIEVDFSLPSERLIRSLKQIISWRGKPQVIRCDKGPENISGTI